MKHSIISYWDKLSIFSFNFMRFDGYMKTGTSLLLLQHLQSQTELFFVSCDTGQS